MTPKTNQRSPHPALLAIQDRTCGQVGRIVGGRDQRDQADQAEVDDADGDADAIVSSSDSCE
jgi:hypothetical protein